MKKNNLYISVTVGLVLTAAFLTYYITSIVVVSKRDTGYTMHYFVPSCGSGTDVLEKMRKYQTYYLTADTTMNKQTINVMQSYLNNLKKVGDSIHGVHITMSNDMPYKFYIKSIEIFNQLPPRLFFHVNNNFYAISKSKYQLIQDSIAKVQESIDGIEVVEIDGYAH
jgi:hypothetical protein